MSRKHIIPLILSCFSGYVPSISQAAQLHQSQHWDEAVRCSDGVRLLQSYAGHDLSTGVNLLQIPDGPNLVEVYEAGTLQKFGYQDGEQFEPDLSEPNQVLNFRDQVLRDHDLEPWFGVGEEDCYGS